MQHDGAGEDTESALLEQQRNLGRERRERGQAAAEAGDDQQPPFRREMRRLHEVRDRQSDHVTARSEEHTSELQSLMRISYAVFCLKNKNKITTHNMNNKQCLHKILNTCKSNT